MPLRTDRIRSLATHLRFRVGALLKNWTQARNESAPYFRYT